MEKRIWILMVAVLLCVTGCQSTGKPVSEIAFENVHYPEYEQVVGEFSKPPEGVLMSPEGEIPLTMAGYDWTVEKGNGAAVSTVADQASRPVPRDSVTPYMLESDDCPELSWETQPSAVALSCWPDSSWKDGDTTEESVVTDGMSFRAKAGGWIYEITAEWADTGEGYHGSARYYVYLVNETESHDHPETLTQQTVDDPVTGYCGNTWTTLHLDGKEYGFMGGYSVALTDLLVNLRYDPALVCKCLPEFTVDTEFGKNYGIHLSAGYARCEKGQAPLTREQIDTVAEILRWAEATGCQYLVG